jgi:ribosomal 30S subunit maturation factor RimM
MSDKQNCSKILEAIDMMKYYIDHYQFQEDEYYMQQLIRFHVGQLYADVGDYISALKYFI